MLSRVFTFKNIIYGQRPPERNGGIVSRSSLTTLKLSIFSGWFFILEKSFY
nr:MAG TPA: hypothetical protein [Caudoviricetes sp.]